MPDREGFRAPVWLTEAAAATAVVAATATGINLAEPPPGAPATADAADTLLVASFNVKWVGGSKVRKNDDLAEMMSPYDIVLVQEIVAPPYEGTFPDGRPYRPDEESAAFFDAMQDEGFAYVLSPEDTGTGESNNKNSAQTEWFAAFYRPEFVAPAPDLPGGFLHPDRTANPSWDRVPYAFPFRTVDENLDFVLISVHLHPDAGPKHRARRQTELEATFAWINTHNDSERDFLVAGDMNFQNCDELTNRTPIAHRSLNEACFATNTAEAKNPKKGRPYDNVIINPADTVELDFEHGFLIYDLLAYMEDHWDAETDGPYPGDPYDGKRFIAAFSDHHPVEFRLTVPAMDDD